MSVPAIGVTGGIGSGKTVVCNILRSLGVPCYDADSRARHLMQKDARLQSEIISQFGDQAYSGGELDRQWLASEVFGNQEKLALLNSLVHPRVGEDFRSWAADSDYQYVVKEAALLFEAGSYKELDEVVLVKAPKEVRIKRILERDPYRSKEQIVEIMKRQWADEKKEKLATHVINNDGSTLITPHVLDLHDRFLNKTRQPP